MWRAQLHRRKPRAAPRENSGAGGSRRTGTALLPEKQPTGRGPLGSAPLSLRPGQGRGSPSAGFCPRCTGAAGPGGGQSSRPTCRWQGHGWSYAADGQKHQPSRVRLTRAHTTGPQQPARDGCALAPEQRIPRSELRKAVPTKTVLLLRFFLFFNDVDWQSPALWDRPRRLLMLSFLEHKGGVNGLTRESWLPWPWGIYCL